jgi:hypothetical protein
MAANTRFMTVPAEDVAKSRIDPAHAFKVCLLDGEMRKKAVVGTDRSGLSRLSRTFMFYHLGEKPEKTVFG